MLAIEVPVDARSSISEINSLQDALALFLRKRIFFDFLMQIVVL
jgi:hypothetical protein